jgi:hypothetical protein
LLREAARQLLPEPRPAPAAYEHPSQYTRACRGVCYSDGMYPGYRPTLFTRIFAGATLGVYLAVPYIIGLIALAAVWSAWARGAAALVLATYLLPLGPVMVRRVLDAYVFLAWRRYFRFSFVFDEPLDAYKDYIIAQFPHGAFPLGEPGGSSTLPHSPARRPCAFARAPRPACAGLSWAALGLPWQGAACGQLASCNRLCIGRHCSSPAQPSSRPCPFPRTQPPPLIQLRLCGTLNTPLCVPWRRSGRWQAPWSAALGWQLTFLSTACLPWPQTTRF